jgi:hypothetical protein
MGNPAAFFPRTLRACKLGHIFPRMAGEVTQLQRGSSVGLPGAKGVRPSWRGELNRSLPTFDTPRLFGVCQQTRREVLAHLEASLAEVRRDLEGPWAASKHERIARLALETARYGSIYWATAPTARAALTTMSTADLSVLDQYGAWLGEPSVQHRVWHGAISRFLRDAENRNLITGPFVPKGAFQPLDSGVVCVRADELHALTGDAPSQTGVFDLHDFAHQAAASLCPELYGNRFHTPAFEQLPPSLADLVAGFDSDRIPQHADGTVFGGFLGHLFNEWDDYEEPESTIVEGLAERIVPYMLGEGTLYLPAQERRICPSRSVNAPELAVLAQNKAYELPASELEQLMFTRGGGDGRDELEQLSPSERLQAIAALRRRTFHELRNTLKHRAQKLAYERTVEELRGRAGLADEERHLLANTFRHLRFLDYRSGLRRDLFRDVAIAIGKRRAGVPGAYPLLGGPSGPGTRARQ